MTIESNKKTHLSQVRQKVFLLALPMAGIQLINVASGFLCMVMLSRLGNEVLAASALIFSTQISVIIIGISTLLSLSILIGHAYGAQNYSAIGSFVRQGWALGILISIPIMIFLWHIDDVFTLLKQEKFIVQTVKTFFHAYVWAVPAILLLVCNQQLCYGTHKQKLIVFTSSLGVTILLTTAYVLIFGKLGMPPLGVAGLGYAMAAQFWFSLIFTTIYFYRDAHFKHFELFTYRTHENWDHLVQMFKIGWPISVQMGGEMLWFFANSTMIGWLGVRALAASQVVTQYFFLIVIPIFALSQATGILIGQARGKKQLDEIKTLGNVCITFAFVLTLFIAVIFVLFPRYLSILYLDVTKSENTEIVRLIVLLFAIAALTQIFDGVKNVLTGALRGLFDTKFPMIIGLAVIWLLGLPLSYFLAFILHWGVVGFSIGSTCGMLVGAVIMMYRWRALSKKIEGS